MLRDAAVSMIQEQLAFRTTLSSNIITYLQLAQSELETGPIKPWFLASEDSYVRTDSAEQRVLVPTDFLEETDQAVLRYVPDTVTTETPERDLVKDDYDVLRKNYMDISTGTLKVGPPESYALTGTYFRIFPVPDDLYLLRMIYYKNDTSLDTNVENNWLKWTPMLLMGKAGQMIAGGPLRDTAAMAIFTSWEQKGLDSLNRQNVSRDMSNRDMQVGGPH